MKSVCCIDDCPEDVRKFSESLRQVAPDIEIAHAATIEGLEKYLDDGSQFSGYFVDYYLGPITAVDVITHLKLRHEKAPICVLTGDHSAYTATQCFHLGATEYLVKDGATIENVKDVLTRMGLIHRESQ